MKLFNLRMVLLFLIMQLAVTDCGGGGDTPPDDQTNTGGTTGGTNNQTTPAISGFDFPLQEGDFWEFAWDMYEQTWNQSSGSSTKSAAAGFRVTLGAPVTIDGYTAYPLEISGTAGKLSPRWQYVAISRNQILGSTDGTTMEVIFDAQTGYWSGGGFFYAFPNNLITAAVGTITSHNRYISGSAIQVGVSDSQSTCESIGGIQICGDESFDYKRYEYYYEGIGPIGYFFENIYSFSGGGFSSGGTLRDNVGLIASSLDGDTASYILEIEPNNNKDTNAMELSLPASVAGFNECEHPFSSNDIKPCDSDFGGSTTVSITKETEVEQNDGPIPTLPDYSPQSVSFPTSISGTIEDSDISTNVYIQPANQTLSLEDWYTFNIATSGSVIINLDFSQSTDADLDVYLFGTNSMTLYSYSYDDNVNGTKVFTESLVSGSLSPGSYQVGIDAFSTPSGSVGYTLGIDTNPVSNQVDVTDWYKFTLASETTISITYEADAGKLVITDGLENTLKQVAAQSGSVATDTITLQAGTYYVGLSDDDAYHFTLE